MPVAGGWGLVTHLGDEVLKAGDDVGALKDSAVVAFQVGFL